MSKWKIAIPTQTYSVNTEYMHHFRSADVPTLPKCISLTTCYLEFIHIHTYIFIYIYIFLTGSNLCQQTIVTQPYPFYSRCAFLLPSPTCHNLDEDIYLPQVSYVPITGYLLCSNANKALIAIVQSITMSKYTSHVWLWQNAVLNKLQYM